MAPLGSIPSPATTCVKVLRMKSFNTLHEGQETGAGSGSGSAVKAIAGDTIGVAVNATEVTTSLDLSIEWSPDGVNFGGAETPDSFTQLTATGVVAKNFSVKGPYYRLAWTTGGDCTFLVTSTS